MTPPDLLIRSVCLASLKRTMVNEQSYAAQFPSKCTLLSLIIRRDIRTTTWPNRGALQDHERRPASDNERILVQWVALDWPSWTTCVLRIYNKSPGTLRPSTTLAARLLHLWNAVCSREHPCMYSHPVTWHTDVFTNGEALFGVRVVLRKSGTRSIVSGRQGTPRIDGQLMDRRMDNIVS